MPNDSNEPRDPFTPDQTPTPPQAPPQPSAPFQPLPPVEPTPVNELTPPVAGVVEPTPEPKKSKKKWIFIGAGAALLIALLVGGYFGLKTWADNTAVDYARSIDTYMDDLFAKKTRTERLEYMNGERVTLQPVFLGSVVSPTYKNAEQTLVPLYNTTVDMAKIGTKAARDSTETLSSVLQSIRSAILSGTPQNYSNKDGLNAEYIASSIEGSFKVADGLEASADQLEKATTLNTLPSYQKAVDATHKWADARREIANYSAAWVSDLVDWADADLEEISNNLKNFTNTNEVKSFDTAGYKAKMDQLNADYRTTSDAAIKAFSDLVEEKISGGVDDKTQKLLDDANKKLDELDKKLEEFVPAEELKNED